MSNQGSFTGQSVPAKYACLVVRAELPAEVSKINKVKTFLNKAQISLSVSEIKAAMAAAAMILVGGIIAGVASIAAGCVAIGGGAAMVKGAKGQKAIAKNFEKELTEQVKDPEKADSMLTEMEDLSESKMATMDEATTDEGGVSEGIDGQPTDSNDPASPESLREKREELTRKRDTDKEQLQNKHLLAQQVASNSQVVSSAPSQIGQGATESTKKREEAVEGQMKANHSALDTGNQALGKTVDSVLRANTMPPLMRMA